MLPVPHLLDDLCYACGRPYVVLDVLGELVPVVVMVLSWSSENCYLTSCKFHRLVSWIPVQVLLLVTVILSVDDRRPFTCSLIARVGIFPM